MALISRTEFLKPAPRRYLTVALPVSGASVRLRSLTEGEKEAYEAELLTADGKPSRDRLQCARRKLVQLCLVDEHGELLLSPADLDALKGLDGADMAALQETLQEHVGFKSGDIEKLVGNSGAGPAGDSPSGSAGSGA